MTVEQRGKAQRQRDNTARLNLFLLESVLFALHMKHRACQQSLSDTNQIKN